jgi:hypothetical protein
MLTDEGSLMSESQQGKPVRHPLHKSICEFLAHLIDNSRLSWGLVDCALGLIQRVRESSRGFSLCTNNFVVLTTTAFMLTFKLDMDFRIPMAFWSKLSCLPPSTLAEAERKVLSCLNFELLDSRSTNGGPLLRAVAAHAQRC